MGKDVFTNKESVMREESVRENNATFKSKKRESKQSHFQLLLSKKTTGRSNSAGGGDCE